MADSQSHLRQRLLALAEPDSQQTDLGGERFRALAERSPIGMFHLDLVGRTIYRNKVLADLLGIARFEPLGADGALHLNLIHPDDNERFALNARRAMEAKESFEIEVRYLTPDGRELWVLECCMPEFDQAGLVAGYIGSVVDITERKRLEELAQRERQLILHISNGLSTSSGKRFFHKLCSELAEALAVDVVFIREYRSVPRPHFSDVANLYRGAPTPALSYLLTSTHIANMVDNPRPMVVVDFVTANTGVDLLFDEPMPVLVCYPLWSASNSLLGYMGIMHSQLLDMELAERLVRIFSQRAATEFERERSQQVLAEQRENLRWINALSVRLHGCADLAEIGRVAVSSIADHVSAPSVSISLLVEGDSDRIQVLASNRRPDLITGPNRRIGPIFDLIYGGDGVLVVDDLASTFGTLPRYLAWADERGIVEQALVLLHHGERELGLVMIDYTERGQVGRLDIESLRALGRTLSLAVSNVQHTADLEYRATHDSLTGLFSRNVLHHTFAAAVGAIAALLLLDLDRFKEINDTLGHAVGDRLLLQIGPRLSVVLGERPQLLCRMGGDEFALLLPQLQDTDEAQRIAQALLLALQQPFEVDGMRLQIGASIGIACYPEHGADSHALLRSADVAMYEAKRAGCGLMVYDAVLDRNTPQRLALIGDLGNAIRNGELCLHYQPKLELGSGQLWGFEALVRWQHPQYGLLSPDQFLPLAEMSDAIHLLTAEVLSLACADLAQWRAQGLDYSVAVNLSARNLLDDQCALLIEQLVATHQLAPHALELEITETALMHDPERAAALLQRIAASGVTVAIDDYGTGYSSLAYLRRLPIRALKIDRTFVFDMVSSRQDAVIVQSTIQLAHNLGLTVVAEGVECAAALHMLRGMGCDQAQGYHLGRPMPRSQIDEWARRARVI